MMRASAQQVLVVTLSRIMNALLLQIGMINDPTYDGLDPYFL